jgi:hypothetical protein
VETLLFSPPVLDFSRYQPTSNGIYNLINFESLCLVSP